MSDTPKVDALPGDAEAAPQPSPGPEQPAPPTTEFPAAGSGATPQAGQATAAPNYVPPVADPFAGPAPSNQAGAFGGAIPEDRPELLLAASLAGGVLAAIVLRTLVRR